MTTYTLLLILTLIIAIALILIVMVQNPKEGGLSSAFGGSANTIGGVQNTNTFLDRSTWTLAIAMFALILLSNFAIPRGNVSGTPELENTLDGIQKTVPAEVPPTTPEATTTDTIVK